MPPPPDRSAQRRTRPAEPPRKPEPDRSLERRAAEREQSLAAAERREHFSLLSGVLWTAVGLLGVSLLRAGAARAFVPGWWRQW